MVFNKIYNYNNVLINGNVMAINYLVDSFVAIN